MIQLMNIGPSRFVALVSDVAPLLRELKNDAGPHAVFVQRLEFAIRYAEFHQHDLKGDMENAGSALMSIFEESLSPSSWLAVLLNDAIPLLQDGLWLFGFLLCLAKILNVFRVERVHSV